MKRSITNFLVLLMLALSSNVSANLIENGSFEDDNMSNINWKVFDTINGWDTYSGAGIEIQTNPTLNFIDAQDGHNYVELDSHSYSSSPSNSSMIQEINGLTIGQSYDLSFWYSARTDWGNNSNGINVLWGSSALLEVFNIENKSRDNIWHEFTQSLTATGTTMSLVFEADGRKDTYGGLIDNVKLNATSVPEPSIIALFGIGLIGLGFVRRSKKQN